MKLWPDFDINVNMQTLKNLLIIIIIIALFIIFKPHIMRVLEIMKSEVAPLGEKTNATYKEFKEHDVYKKERDILKSVDEER